MRYFTIALAMVPIILSVGVREGTAGNPEAQPQTVFERMDGADHDGKITRDEHRASRSAWYKKMDADQDRALSEDEFLAEEFQMLDGPDEDGVVTEEEYAIFFVGKDALEAYRQVTVPDKDPEKFGFDVMDSNADGIVTVKEFIVMHKGLFEEMDPNHDRKITKDEFDAYRKDRVKLGDRDKDGKVNWQEFTPVRTKPEE